MKHSAKSHEAHHQGAEGGEMLCVCGCAHAKGLGHTIILEGALVDPRTKQRGPLRSSSPRWATGPSA